MKNEVRSYTNGDHTLTVWNRNGELLFKVVDVFDIAGFDKPDVQMSEALFSDMPNLIFVTKPAEPKEDEFDSELFTNLWGAMSMAERTFYYHPARMEPPNIEAFLDMLDFVVVPYLEYDQANELLCEVGKSRQFIHELRHPSWEASLN